MAENDLTVFIRVKSDAEMTDTVFKLLNEVTVLTAGNGLHLEASCVVCAGHYDIAKLYIILDVGHPFGVNHILSHP